MKPFKIDLYRSNFMLPDRCSTFNQISPGGNWFDCEQLTNLTHATITESQKCCMYNLDWTLTFEDANLFCERFDSQLYSLKTKGFEHILETYAAYLNTNYAKTKENENLFLFWTSCKLRSSIPNVLTDHEAQCGNEEITFKKYRNHPYEYPDYEVTGLVVNSIKVSTSPITFSPNLIDLSKLNQAIEAVKKFSLNDSDELR